MSMLAEQKKKKRWNINPRGTLWTNDETKFGQKLLEKMGWSKGKGLGKEEQGCKEPIRVTMNEEQKGVGYKEKGESEWTKHYDAFEDVLSSLNSLNNTNEETAVAESFSEIESLEKKSKVSRSRVHYHKFTRGKDLSRYNEDDLACVLGSKRLKGNKTEKDMEQQSETTETSVQQEITEIGQTDKSHGLTTIHGGNLKEYFSLKMNELKRKRDEGILGCDAEQDVENMSFPNFEYEPEKQNFSFNISQNITDVGDKQKDIFLSKKKDSYSEETYGDSGTVTKAKKNKKSKKQKKHLQQETMEEVGKINYTKKIKKEKKRSKSEEKIPQLSHEKEKKQKKRKERVEIVDTVDQNENSSKITEIHESPCVTLHLNGDCSKSILTDSIEGSESSQTKTRKKNKRSDRGKEEIHSEVECIIQETDELDIIRENEVNRVRELNESYDLATSEKSKKTRKAKMENEGDQAPLKKIKKLASELHLADVFKSSSNLVPVDEVSDCGKPLSEKKIKLSAKKSFKEIKKGMEAKLKLIKKKHEQDSLAKVPESDKENLSNNQKIENVVEESTVSYPEDTNQPLEDKGSDTTLKSPKSKRKKRSAMSVEVDLDELFPGSNLGEIKGYDHF